MTCLISCKMAEHSGMLCLSQDSDSSFRHMRDINYLKVMFLSQMEAVEDICIKDFSGNGSDFQIITDMCQSNV